MRNLLACALSAAAAHASNHYDKYEHYYAQQEYAYEPQHQVYEDREPAHHYYSHEVAPQEHDYFTHAYQEHVPEYRTYHEPVHQGHDYDNDYEGSNFSFSNYIESNTTPLTITENGKSIKLYVVGNASGSGSTLTAKYRGYLIKGSSLNKN